VPEANSRWTDEALELYAQIDIGVATAVEGRGLVVPVIRDVAALDLKGDRGAARRPRDAARAQALDAGPTCAAAPSRISNHGVSGSLLAAPIIINQPQARSSASASSRNARSSSTGGGSDSIEVRPRCYVTLTLDHRVMDGHQANRFLAAWVGAIEGWDG